MGKYDCYQDGIEEEIVGFFKTDHSEYYDAAQKEADHNDDPSPSEICEAFEKADKEELFYEIVKNWFHETYPEDYK